MHRAHMIEKAAYIPENKLEMVCIIQLGMIEPLAFFSLIYPINHAITPVNIMIKIVFKTGNGTAGRTIQVDGIACIEVRPLVPKGIFP